MGSAFLEEPKYRQPQSVSPKGDLREDKSKRRCGPVDHRQIHTNLLFNSHIYQVCNLPMRNGPHRGERVVCKTASPTEVMWSSGNGHQ